jgi:gamma-glutamylcysteine synthetase
VADQMMCSTAAMQVTVDAGPQAGWARRVDLIQALGPIFVAIAAGSPWLAGQRTGWGSTRQRIWGDLVGFGPSPAADPVSAWVEWALDSPVMVVAADDDPPRPVTEHISLRQWASGVHWINDRLPAAADFDRHLRHLFPPVRLRGTIEIRYLDALPHSWWPAVVAALVTLIDHPQAAAAAAVVVGDPTYRQAFATDLWHRAAQVGLADPLLARAADACLAVAARWADTADIAVAAEAAELPAPGIGPDVARLAAAVQAGRGPGADLLDRPALLTDPLAQACHA